MKLKQYRNKRDFKKTAEPRGKKVSARRGKKKFVVQKHAASHLHYDFRLELNGVLLSWAVPKGPCLDPAVKRLAVHVEDHPLEYGGFEGIIAKGQYGAGTVMLWDRGEWISEDEDPEAAYKKGNMKFVLKGSKLKGAWKLVRIRRDEKNWLLMKVQDKYAKKLKDYDVTQKRVRSVLSRLNMDQITRKFEAPESRGMIKLNRKRAKFPSSISPQLAVLSEEAPEGKEWMHEIKFDGYRILAYKHNASTRLYSRNQKNWTQKFHAIAEAINALDIPDVVFDGEVVVLDKKQRSSFQLLQNAFKHPDGAEFIYYIFDLLYYDHSNLESMPLIERKELLEKLFDYIDADNLRYSDHIIGSGKKILAKSCKIGLEGIVSKKIHSQYHQKRTSDWLKSKCTHRQEFVICGYTAPARSRNYFGSLLLGTYNEKRELVFHGNVGTGFSEELLRDIYQRLSKLRSTKSPFAQTVKLKNVTWVKPVLVAEVEFTEWTNEGALRHPSFLGLRLDKSARSVVREDE